MVIIDALLKKLSERVWFAVTLVLSFALGVCNIFLQDDAFISFRYAKNLALHGNFSWNANDVVKIEGYTNFLWTILMSIGIKLGIEPTVLSIVLGLLIGLGTLFVVYAMASIILGDRRSAILSVFLVGTNYTFSAYMTGGLETQLVTLLVMSCFWMLTLAINSDTPARFLVGAGLFSGLAILTRIDSVLLCGSFMFLIVVLWIRNKIGIARLVQYCFLLGLPIILVVGPWLFWKYGYYGDLLPNSFYLKGTAHSGAVLKAGLGFVFSFFSSYFLTPFVLLIIFYAKSLWKNNLLMILAGTSAFWILYIIKVGGDFMEYRFFVPIIPLLMILIAWAIGQVPSLQWKAFMLVAILAGSLSHAIMFKDFWGTHAVTMLRNDVSEDRPNWTRIGKRLKQDFPGGVNDIVIAVNAAGAIPYYSELPTIDMLGVNDRFIAVNGIANKAFFRPGHNKSGPLSYYLETKPHLIIGNPQIREKNWKANSDCLTLEDFRNFEIPDLERGKLPAGAKIIRVPLDEEHDFFVLCLFQDVRIDQWVTSNKLKTYPV